MSDQAASQTAAASPRLDAITVEETDASSARIQVQTTPEIEAMIARLGRTEDVCFSPDDTSLAVAGYGESSCCIFKVAVERSGAVPRMVIHGWSEIHSDAIRDPHGLAFAGNDHLVVGNRRGKIAIFDLRGLRNEGKPQAVDPVRIVNRANMFHRVHAPGSVCVTEMNGGRIEILACNNFKHQVTRHRVPLRAGPALPDNAIVLERYLDIPDGIAIDPTGRWVAVSNHNTHEVLFYDRKAGLNRRADPDGKGLETGYPHGVRFFDDGRLLCVTDAGSPFLRFFRSQDNVWSGEHRPVLTVRVLDQQTFLRGHVNEMEGGAKGIAFNAREDILAVTCEEEALAFFHTPSLLRGINA